MEKPGRLFCLIVLGIFLYLLPSTGEAVTVNCPTDSLQAAINAAAPYVTITVSGTCNENIFIDPGKHAITLDGGGTATIIYPLTDVPTIGVAATWVTIKGFTIKGGGNGVMIGPGGFATLDSNNIKNTGADGIVVTYSSSAFITNNTIENNPDHGILVNYDSYADIGVGMFGPGSNTIQNNGQDGVKVKSSSSATIVGNIIRNNNGNGVEVITTSHANISSNTINGNVQYGVVVGENSAIALGSDAGNTIFDLPNTTTVDNGQFGLICYMGAYVTGRLGTLNGVNGPIDNGYVGIKTSSLSDITDYGIDIMTASNGLIRLGNALDNNTTKAARMVVRHYNNAEEPVYLFGAASTSADNFVAFGGGSTLGNAATQLDLFTAPNTTTPIGTSRITIKGNGYIGIGTQAPSYPLQMAGGAYSNGGSWIDASSREYKDDIQRLTSEEALEAFQRLDPVRYAYKKDKTEKRVGFIAEDVPELVSTKDRKGLSPMDIVAVLTKVVQEQQKTISALREELNELKEKVR